MGYRLFQKLAKLSEVIKINFGKPSEEICVRLEEIFQSNRQDKLMNLCGGGQCRDPICGKPEEHLLRCQKGEECDDAIIGGSKTKVTTSDQGKLVIDNEHVTYGENETYPVCSCQHEEGECTPSILDFYKMAQLPTKTVTPRTTCRNFVRMKQKTYLRTIPPCNFQIAPPSIKDCNPKRVPLEYFPPPFPNLEPNEDCLCCTLQEAEALPKPEPFVPKHQVEEVARHKLEIERRAKEILERIWSARAQKQGCQVCTCPAAPKLPEEDYCKKLQALMKTIKVYPVPLLPKYKTSKKRAAKPKKCTSPK